MIGNLAALILLSAMSLIQTAEVPRLISLTEAKTGDNLTLAFPVSGGGDRFLNVFKLPLGHMIQKVSTAVIGRITVMKEFASRFNVTKGDDQYIVTIKNVSKDDEAIYLCQHGTAYEQTFSNGTFLAVNDWNQQKHVKQSPETASVQLGDPVTLRCSLFYENERNKVPCPAENSVYWFRAGAGGFHPGVIYPQRSDEEEERSCVYSLSKTILNSSDAGIYYCAVVTCGEILFGGGTTVETKSGLDPVVLVLGGLLVCCVTAIAVLIFCGNQRVCKHVEGAGSASHHSGHGQTNNVDDEGLSYAALSFSSKRTKRLRKTNESQQECTYSEYIG